MLVPTPRLIALVAALAVLTLAGCAARQGPEVEAAVAPGYERAQAVGLANPASVHCQDMGGRLEIHTEADGGEYGMCRLPDGRVCEEWALYRDGECTSGPEE